MPPTSVRIVPLADCPEAAPQLAAWHFAQWGWMNPANTIEARIARFERHMTPGSPTTFVALLDGLPVGSASLTETDMTTRPDLTPWLASVFVAPHARRNGIGGALVDRVVQEAARDGVPEMYLFTPDQMPLYASLGWQIVEQVTYQGELETIMRICPADRVASAQ